MAPSIFVYRALQWLNHQSSEDIRSLPEAVVPTEEQEAVHDDLRDMGLLRVPESESLAGGDQNFLLNSEGKRRARRWGSDYLVHSAAYEILQAIPTGQYEDLTSVADAFQEDQAERVTGETFTQESIAGGAKVLQDYRLITGTPTSGGEILRIGLTSEGQHVRREHLVPGLGTTDDTRSSNVSQYNSVNIHGGTVGAAQAGQTNSAQVHVQIADKFQEIRELVQTEAPAEDQEELLGQLDELQAAAESGEGGTFANLRNRALGGFASKVGDKAATLLLQLPTELVG